MPLQTFGSVSSPISQKVTYQSTTTTAQRVDEIVCEWADRDDNTPAIGATSGSYTLTQSQVEQDKAGLCKITLTWDTAIASSESLPSTTYEEDVSTVELDIRQHPNFGDWSDDWDDEKEAFKPDSDKAGISSYIVGSTTVTKIEYFSSQPTSDYELIGTLVTPGGGFSGSNKWLVVGCSRRKAGENLYTKETKYLYSAKEWNTDIYS